MDEVCRQRRFRANYLRPKLTGLDQGHQVIVKIRVRLMTGICSEKQIWRLSIIPSSVARELAVRPRRRAYQEGIDRFDQSAAAG